MFNKYQGELDVGGGRGRIVQAWEGLLGGLPSSAPQGKTTELRSGKAPIPSALELVRDVFESRLLPRITPTHDEITERNKAVTLLQELLKGKSVSQTTVGKFYAERLKERMGGEVDPHLRRRLAKELKRWKNCKFPGDCNDKWRWRARCRCRARLLCEHSLQCKCEACQDI